MIYSLGLILIFGFIIGYLLNKVKIPGLVGMIIVGLVIGPYCLNLLAPEMLNISKELRTLALVIILTRSGLNLDLESLKKIGRPAILMCFVPATFEIIGVTIASYYFLNLTIIEGLLMGSVLAAVSPAVVSPRMIKLIDEGYGNVPKIILAGSSVDDIYVIILFNAFFGLLETNQIDFLSFVSIPTSIILGIILGLILGLLLSIIFKKLKFNATINILLTLGISFLLIGLELIVKPYIQLSALLGIMVMGMIILFKNKEKAVELSKGYNQLWLFFEIILFVLVGATIDISYAINNALLAIITLIIGLLFRVVGVLVSLIKTNLNKKEKLFTVISYLPKATVQASIGGIALAGGLACGSIVLTVSVLSILITAPIGAILIDNFSKKLLNKELIDLNI